MALVDTTKLAPHSCPRADHPCTCSSCPVPAQLAPSPFPFSVPHIHQYFFCARTRCNAHATCDGGGCLKSLSESTVSMRMVQVTRGTSDTSWPSSCTFFRFSSSTSPTSMFWPVARPDTAGRPRLLRTLNVVLTYCTGIYGHTTYLSIST